MESQARSHALTTSPRDAISEATDEEVEATATDKTACARVICVFELLEGILLLLPLRQCLLSQRVSRVFQETIAASLPLQCKLFLRASEAVTSDLGNVQMNSLLVNVGLPVVYQHGTAAPKSQNDRTRLVVRDMAVLHNAPKTKGRVCLDLSFTESDGESELTDGGSWRRMGLCQPPLRVRWEVQTKGAGQFSVMGWLAIKETGTVEEMLEALAEKRGVE